MAGEIDSQPASSSHGIQNVQGKEMIEAFVNFSSN